MSGRNSRQPHHLIAECKMESAEWKRTDYPVVFEFLLAVFIDEIEIATSWLASVRIGAAVAWSVFRESTRSSGILHSSF